MPSQREANTAKNMQDLIDFFLKPYQNAFFFDIGLEIAGAFFGVISVLFAKKENIWVYPTGLVSTGIYVFVCFQHSLYGDVLINLYYSLMSLYGWFVWSKKTGDHPLAISKCNASDWQKAGWIFLFTGVLVMVVYLYAGKFDRWTDFFDTFTTGIFFAGMWLMANKKVENWMFWLVGNAISIPLYFYKGLGFSGIQFALFFLLAYRGHHAWKKRMTQTALPT
jgi:nicotinamide mononucleotide transporter